MFPLGWRASSLSFARLSGGGPCDVKRFGRFRSSMSLEVVTVKKRIGAFLCALLLAFNLATTAPRARAVSAALAAVGVGVVLGAALCAAGIYPYKAAESFGEWTSDKLSSLWSQFCDSSEGQAIGATVEMFRNGDIKGFQMGANIIMARAVYNPVITFVNWVRTQFSLTDNQTGVELGEVSAVGTLVPVCNMNVSSVLAGGIAYAMHSGGWYYYLGSTVSGICIFYYGESSVCAFLPNGDGFVVGEALRYTGGANLSNFYTIDTHSTGGQVSHVTVDGILYRAWVDGNHASNSRNPAIPAYATMADGIRAITGTSQLDGITADTGTTKALDPLPADKEYGGLAVAGSDTLNTPTDVIEQGITDREKPVVRPVEVDLEGVEMDTETGELTENPVVVTPDVAIPGIQDLTVPQTFLDKLETAMRTKFPFCLPFDFMRFIAALNMTPEAPRFSLTFHDPFTDTDYTITVDLSPWDGVAALVRQLESVLLLLGFWFNFDKFNLLNIILGQLG